MKLRHRRSFKTKVLLSSAAVSALAAAQSRATTVQSIALWDLSNFTDGQTVVSNSPAPSFGVGTATALGMTNSYTYTGGAGGNVTGSVATCDVTPQVGDVNAQNGLCWRVRGAGPGNGWNLAAPQYTQGAEFDASTVGHSNIVFNFDWFSTTQGVNKMQEQYTTDGSTWININPLQTAAANGWILADASSGVNTIDFAALGIHGVDNNANFGVRLVSAYDPAVGTYGSANGGQNGVYNNNSGNWRFQDINIGFTSTNVAAVPPTLTYTPPGGTWVANGTTAATMNFQNTNGVNVPWLNGATNYTAAFTGNGIPSGGTATISVSTNGVSAASVLVSNTNGTYVFSGGPIGGGPLVKSGNGVMVVSGLNNFTSVTVSGGTLRSNADLALGNIGSRLTLDGGTLQLTAANTLNRQLKTSLNGGTLDTGTNAVTLTNFVALGAFTKLGSGNLTFNGGVSSFDGTGAFTLKGGNLIFSATSGVSTLVAPTNSAGFAGNLIVTGASRLNFNGGIVDGGTTTADIEIQTSGWRPRRRLLHPDPDLRHHQHAGEAQQPQQARPLLRRHGHERHLQRRDHQRRHLRLQHRQLGRRQGPRRRRRPRHLHRRHVDQQR